MSENGITVKYVRSNELYDIFQITGTGYGLNHFESYTRGTTTEKDILSAITA